MVYTASRQPTRCFWSWSGRSQPLQICYDRWGDGPQQLLLLPALSTVSHRSELAALAQELLTQCPGRFQITVLDWPGFGESDRLPLAYGPSLYRQFLQDFVEANFTEAIAVIAAGHASGYAMALAAQGLWSQIVLVAPTWRGPLAVMGLGPRVRRGIEGLVRSPLLGQLLYGLNTQPAFLKWMYQRHVFVNRDRLTPDYIAQRHRNTQKPGARYAPAAFVTGGLDPAQTRQTVLDWFSPPQPLPPTLILVADQAPPTSKAEMETLAALPQVQAQHLPGTLGVAEELGVLAGQAIAPFLTT